MLRLSDRTNPYIYVHGSPLMGVDPKGLCKCKNTGKNYKFGGDEPDKLIFPQSKRFECVYSCTSDSGINFLIKYTKTYNKPWFNRASLFFVCPYVEIEDTTARDSLGIERPSQNAITSEFDPRESNIPEIKKLGDLWCGEECKI